MTWMTLNALRPRHSGSLREDPPLSKVSVRRSVALHGAKEMVSRAVEVAHIASTRGTTNSLSNEYCWPFSFREAALSSMFQCGKGRQERVGWGGKGEWLLRSLVVLPHLPALR